MGIKNGVPIFQRVAEHCLRTVAAVANVYVDDIIVGTHARSSEEETIHAHMDDIRSVLKCLYKEVLFASSSKCGFFVKEVEFCGHILGGADGGPLRAS